jgi:ribosomal protein S18 acetylase RimI-like enzyme
LIAGYAAGWGRKHDAGIIAWDGKKPIGAAWIRSWANIEPKGFGHIDDQIPELTMAVLPDFRNRGIGTRLLETLFDIIRDEFPAVSLSVQITNPAKRLYDRFGFQVYKHSSDDCVMIKQW